VTPRSTPRFGRLPIRVAATTTVLVAILYVVVAGIVIAIVRQNLIGAIDGRLLSAVASIQAQGGTPQQLVGATPEDPDADRDGRRFGAPLLIWVIGADGSIANSDPTAKLPASNQRVAVPTDVRVSGTDLRIAGGPIGSGWLAVGQTTADVTRVTQIVLLAEAVIAPVLLLTVFFGSWAIGRRVAAPIERARRRQLDFTADASHELRTPLTVIEAETSLALSSAREPAGDQQAFERINDETHHLGRLVRDLLWLARFDAAPPAPEVAPVDVGTLATTTAERFRAIAEGRGLRLVTRVTGTSSPVINAPAEWLGRLVSVLIDNAVKYSSPGGAVSVEVSTDAGRVRLAVEDTGPGIPASERDRIFDRFHRATDEPGGAGLGLAIADAIVRGTGGRWEIGDAPGGGARMAASWTRTADGTYAARSLEQSVEMGGDQDAVV
jgi:two-component system, OmpR family, sensor histidine kinase CiaH